MEKEKQKKVRKVKKARHSRAYDDTRRCLRRKTFLIAANGFTGVL
jgi:hypothetical protein